MLHARFLLAGEDGGDASLQRQEPRARLSAPPPETFPTHGQKHPDSTAFLTKLSDGVELINCPLASGYQRSYEWTPSNMVVFIICFLTVLLVLLFDHLTVSHIHLTLFSE